MRSPLFLVFLLAIAAYAQTPPAKSNKAIPTTPSVQWERLIDNKQVTRAEKLCTSWVASSDHDKQVEAQKCLANVALCRGSILSINGNEVGGGTLGEGYKPEAVDEALKHLNQGIRLAPQDVSIHQGRLHVLEVAGRFDDMMTALEQSIEIYKGPGTPDIWLAYAAELGNYGQPTAGLHLSEILYKHYPDHSDVIGNLGAFHNMLKQWDAGLPYVQKAVEMHPTDAIDTWNLGWTYYHLEQFENADKWMSKSIQLDSSSNDSSDRKCLYGKFLATKLNKIAEGCALVEKNCQQDDQTVCTAPVQPASATP